MVWARKDEVSQRVDQLTVVVTTEPLRISLSDLITADSRGKWWLVGAGWAGNPLAEREEQRLKTKTAKVMKPAMEQEEQLLEVARKQGMNTDIRRSIFVVLMTSEVSVLLSRLTAGLCTRVRPNVAVQAIRNSTARVCTGHTTLRRLRAGVQPVLYARTASPLRNELFSPFYAAVRLVGFSAESRW